MGDKFIINVHPRMITQLLQIKIIGWKVLTLTKDNSIKVIKISEPTNEITSLKTFGYQCNLQSNTPPSPVFTIGITKALGFLKSGIDGYLINIDW